MSGGSSTQTVGYRYYMGLHLGLCHGPIDALLELRAGDRTAFTGTVSGSGPISINAPELFGGEDREGGLQGTLDVMMGEPAQGANSYLTAQQGTPQPAYRGMLSLVYRGGLVAANNPYVKPWSFRLRRILQGWDGGTIWNGAQASISLGSGIFAANPAHIVYECLTNRKWGMGRSAGKLDLTSFAEAAATFHAEGMGLCFTWNKKEPIESFIQTVCDHAGAAVGEDPRTGLFRIKAIRADYSVGSLPLFSPDAGNIVELESFERGAATDAANEVTVSYIDQATGKQGSVTVQHLAAVQAQGGASPTSVDYPGIPTIGLAMRLALRDLKASTSGLARVRLRVNREAYGLLPGDVIAWSWPDLGISLMPLRIGRIDYGRLTAGTITIEAVQDVFGLPATTYLEPQPGGWVEPDRTPQPSVAVAVFETPYRELARALGPSFVSSLDPDAGFLSAVALRAPGVSQNYQLETRTGSADYVQVDSGEWTPTGTLSAALTPTATTATLTAGVDLDLVSVGQSVLVGTEILRLTSIDALTGEIGIARGCEDTVPVAHASGARAWFFEAFAGSDSTEWATGETVDAKLRTRTSAGLLSVASSPGGSVLMQQRAHRPYPPGQFRVNGINYPATIPGFDGVTVSGVGRDRVLQADQLIDTTAAAIGPEPGTTYSAELRNADTNAVISAQSALGSPSATFALSLLGSAINLRVQLWSVRGGLESLQRHTLTVQRVNDDGTPFVPGAATSPANQQMFYDGTQWIMQRVVTDTPSRAQFYRSTDGITFEWIGTFYGANSFGREERGLALGSSTYLAWPAIYADAFPAPPPAVYFFSRTPRFTLSDAPPVWATNSPTWLATSELPLALAWDATNSRFACITSNKTLRTTTDGITWSSATSLSLPALPWNWYAGMRLDLWKEGSTWYLMHRAGGGQFDSGLTHLMYSSDLATWTLCPGTSFSSPPPGTTWQFYNGYAATSRGSTVIVVAQGRRTGVGQVMRTLVLRATDGINFSLVYDEPMVVGGGTLDPADYTEVKPYGASGFVASGPNGLLVSTDNGATWSPTAMATYPTAMRSDGSRVVANRRTRSVTGGFVNDPWYSDNGTTWTACTIREYRTGSRRHWRLKVQQAVGTVDVALAELVFFDGASALGGYTSSQGAGTGLANIDDANNATTWDATVANIDAGSAWVAYDFGSAVNVTAIELRIGTTTTRAPARLEVQWSEDGTTWNSGWYEEGLTWTSGQNRRFEATS